MNRKSKLVEKIKLKKLFLKTKHRDISLTGVKLENINDWYINDVKVYDLPEPYRRDYIENLFLTSKGLLKNSMDEVIRLKKYSYNNKKVRTKCNRKTRHFLKNELKYAMLNDDFDCPNYSPRDFKLISNYQNEVI